MGAFQVCKWKDTSLSGRLLTEALSREVINVRGTRAAHKPVQKIALLLRWPHRFGDNRKDWVKV